MRRIIYILLISVIISSVCGQDGDTNEVWKGLESEAVLIKFLESETRFGYDVLQWVDEKWLKEVVVGNGTYSLKEVLSDVGKATNKRLILDVANNVTWEKVKEIVLVAKPRYAIMLLRTVRGPNGLPKPYPLGGALDKIKWPKETKVTLGFGKPPGHTPLVYSNSDIHWINPMIATTSKYLHAIELDANLLSNAKDDFLGPQGAHINHFPKILLRNLDPSTDEDVNIGRLNTIIYKWLKREKFILDLGDVLIAKLTPPAKEKPTSAATIKSPTLVLLFLIPKFIMVFY